MNRAFLVLLFLGLTQPAFAYLGGTPDAFEESFHRNFGATDSGVFYARCVENDDSFGSDLEVYLFMPRNNSGAVIAMYDRAGNGMPNIGGIELLGDGKIGQIEAISGAVGTAEYMRMLTVPLLAGSFEVTYDVSQVFQKAPVFQCGYDASTYYDRPAVKQVPLTWWRRLLRRWNQISMISD